jgi:hypothetical protein
MLFDIKAYISIPVALLWKSKYNEAERSATVKITLIKIRANAFESQ